MPLTRRPNRPATALLCYRRPTLIQHTHTHLYTPTSGWLEIKDIILIAGSLNGQLFAGFGFLLLHPSLMLSRFNIWLLHLLKGKLAITVYFCFSHFITFLFGCLKSTWNLNWPYLLSQYLFLLLFCKICQCVLLQKNTKNKNLCHLSSITCSAFEMNFLFGRCHLWQVVGQC